MRSVGLARGPVETLDWPGVSSSDRARLEVEARAVLLAARQTRRSWGAVVVHITHDAVVLRSRSELVGELQSAGVRALARDLARAAVPVGCFLGLIDLDGLTRVTVVSLAVALGDES